MDNNTDNTVEETMLTTTDNPFNPFTQFDEWDAYDKQKGYYTCAYLARVTRTSDDLADKDQTVAIDDAIKEILYLNITGLYVLVSKDSFIERVLSPM